MNYKISQIISVLIVLGFFAITFYAQQNNKATFVNAERDNYAPNLYSEKLDFRATLVDLPGAKLSESSWQVFYEIYFVGEAEFYKVIKNVGKTVKLGNGATRTESSPTIQDFPNKVLLASGNFNKKSLANIADRSVEKKDIDFKSKVFDDLRTGRKMSFAPPCKDCKALVFKARTKF